MRHGCGAIRLWDRRPDPRRTRMERGRSINLALAARGIRALEHAGVMEKVRPLLIPMRGRMIHERSGATTLQPYGQREDEVIYSVGRGELNKVLIEEAARHQDVTIRFNQTCLGADPTQNVLRFRNEVSGAQYSVELTPTIATAWSRRAS
jgi:kynurenine 3-monooxygenase